MELDNQELQKVVAIMLCNRCNSIAHATLVINKAIEKVCKDYGFDSELIYTQTIRELINEKDV